MRECLFHPISLPVHKKWYILFQIYIYVVRLSEGFWVSSIFGGLLGYMSPLSNFMFSNYLLTSFLCEITYLSSLFFWISLLSLPFSSRLSSPSVYSLIYLSLFFILFSIWASLSSYPRIFISPLQFIFLSTWFFFSLLDFSFSIYGFFFVFTIFYFLFFLDFRFFVVSH